MPQYYILTRPGSNHPLKFGSKAEICNEWAKIKYTMAPDEEYVVKEVRIGIMEELTEEQIKNIVEEDYNRWNGE